MESTNSADVLAPTRDYFKLIKAVMDPWVDPTTVGPRADDLFTVSGVTWVSQGFYSEADKLFREVNIRTTQLSEAARYRIFPRVGQSNAAPSNRH